MSDTDKNLFWNALDKANYSWVLISILVGAFGHFLRALRWGLIIDTLGYKPKTHNLFFGVMNMYFFNSFIPRLGEATRCTTLKTYEQIPIDKSFGTVVAERCVDVLCLALLLGGTFLFQGNHLIEMYDAVMRELGAFKQTGEPSFFAKYWKYIALGIGVVIFAILYLGRNNSFIGKIYKKVISLIKGFWSGLKSTFLIKKKLLFVVYSILIWVSYYIVPYLCCFSLPETSHLSPLAPLMILCLGTFAIMLTPNGLGAFPVAVATILMVPAYGSIEQGVGSALGWIMWGAQVSMVMIAGIISLILLPIVNKNYKPQITAK